MPVLQPASPAVPTSALPPPRAFGLAATDLDLDFEQRDRCALATAVVARCCDGDLPLAERHEGALALTLGQRTERLLRIVQLTDENESLAVVLTCPHAACASRFEVALPIEALRSNADADTAAGYVTAQTQAGRRVALRLPTGRDQAAWRRASFTTAHDAALAMIRSLIVVPHEQAAPSRSDAPMPFLDPADDTASAGIADTDLRALSAAMEAADPLVAFTVQTACPQCSREATVPVDLETVALQRLAQRRRAILRTVHDLATRYGWSESEVLAIPARRRVEYLRLIDAAENPLP